MTYFIYNGKTFASGSAVIGPDNRGLRYGDGLFETMKMKNGKLVFETEHFARLWRGLNTLEFEIPKHFTPENLLSQVTALCKKNGHETAARIRLQVTRGDGGLYDAKNHLPNYLVQSWPISHDTEPWNSNGLILGIYEAIKKSADLLSSLKHNNFLPYALAALHAKKQKWNDAILLNTASRICETTIANLFLVKDQQVFTPTLGEACVAGIMRKMLLLHLSNTQTPCMEAPFTIDQLLSADEVFLTNSIYNMRWVQSIAGTSYSNAFTRKIYDGFLPTIS